MGEEVSEERATPVTWVLTVALSKERREPRLMRTPARTGRTATVVKGQDSARAELHRGRLLPELYSLTLK